MGELGLQTPAINKSLNCGSMHRLECYQDDRIGTGLGRLIANLGP